MENKSIAVEISDEESYSLEFDSIRETKKMTVVIDGKKTGGGFRYYISGGEWLSVIVEENNFYVSVRENFNVNERYAFINIHHNDIVDDDTIGQYGEKVVTITQSGVDCSLSAIFNDVTYNENSEIQIVLESLPSSIPEVKRVNVSCIGGNGKFRILSFNEYETYINEDVTKTKNVENDYGIKLRKVSNDCVEIVNYGKVFKENSKYYLITIVHDNDPSKSFDIKVSYNSFPVFISRDSAKSNVKEETPISFKRVKPYYEIIEERYNSNPPMLEIYELNPDSVRRKSKGEQIPIFDDETIEFDNEGGTKSYAINVYPDNAAIEVRITDTFVSYKIEDKILTITVQPNPYSVNRACIISLMNVQDQTNNIVKKIIQKGWMNE